MSFSFEEFFGYSSFNSSKIDFKSSLVKYCAECSKNKIKEIQKRYYSSNEFKEKIKQRKNEGKDKILQEYIKEIGIEQI